MSHVLRPLSKAHMRIDAAGGEDQPDEKVGQIKRILPARSMPFYAPRCDEKGAFPRTFEIMG
jgi:hypothetical protein